jgi:tRNA 2-thiocytidine biosynthesis protein TtcA
MDRNLFDFVGLKPNGISDPEGDLAFDPPTFEAVAELHNASTEDAHEANPAKLGINHQVMHFIKPSASA